MPYVAGYFLCVAEAASLPWVSMRKDASLIGMTARVFFQPGPLFKKVWHGACSNKTEYPADFQRIYPP